MPRHVVRYFMGRRHHRRRIPTASRYISGCTVNPSGLAVRRLHRGRSPEFRERSSPPSSCASSRRDLNLRSVFACTRHVCTYVCTSVRVYCLSSSTPPRSAVVSHPGAPQYISRGPFDVHHHHRDQRRRWWFGYRGFFSFLSSLRFPRSGPRYSVCRARQTARATANCFENGIRASRTGPLAVFCRTSGTNERAYALTKVEERNVEAETKGDRKRERSANGH